MQSVLWIGSATRQLGTTESDFARREQPPRPTAVSTGPHPTLEVNVEWKGETGPAALRGPISEARSGTRS